MVYRYEAVYTAFLSGIPISAQIKVRLMFTLILLKKKITLSIQKTKNNTFLAMYDMQGKLLFKNQYLTGKQKLNFSNFTNGLYLLRLSSGNKEITKRILRVNGCISFTSWDVRGLEPRPMR